MSDTGSSVSVAVWGLGRHAIHKVLPAIAASTGLSLRGVCSRNATTVNECAAAWNCRGWTDPAAMLADPGLDVVYLATPIGLHSEEGKRALVMGKHLWCEKPLTGSLHDTLGLLELAAGSGLSVCECFMYLYHPHFQQVRALLTSGRIGAVLSVDARFGIPALANPGFRDDPLLGGGALLDVGCYPASIVDGLFSGFANTVLFSRVFSPPGSPVDTHGQAVVRISNGVVANLEWRTGAAYRNSLDVWGESGTLSTDRIFSKAADYVPTLRVRDGAGGEIVESGQAGNHFVAMLEHFKQMIGDRAAAESERGRIRARAELLHQITQRAA